MCYAYLVSPSRYDHLDELLTRIFTARQRPEWRRRVLDSTDSVRALSTLRVLRAVERRALSGRAASISDVAEDLAIEHSTASRTVSTVVAAGLLTKSPAADDQRRSLLVLTDVGRKTLAQVTARRRDMVTAVVADWPDEQVDTLVTLLDRLADDFERGADA
ncbi:MarR family winged helix-turn-helix transcriptional regulator [Mycolicibacterium chitae]|uniref:MarR family transcriptional regulator n=1 Tax=Mycolicibacterium chitae TaxID=1792 RepID=A0A448I4B6_MYCCI|nr:MarR family winged helix-turn-helix transcriptional regulator [Mycolicibacterium chitae]MCV7109319.1 winged helix-turn-helix transcriptional regulator [Mycolicibacterium chitae]VEG47200.1 MarR family transcriptional regulator [Mycolicibacterium chitae]